MIHISSEKSLATRYGLKDNERVARKGKELFGGT